MKDVKVRGLYCQKSKLDLKKRGVKIREQAGSKNTWCSCKNGDTYMLTQPKLELELLKLEASRVNYGFLDVHFMKRNHW
jgi:hypothetical protein